MLRWLTALFRSLNFKIFILAAVLFIVLLLLMVKATMIKQRRNKWLRQLNLQIDPIEEPSVEEIFKSAKLKDAISPYMASSLDETARSPQPSEEAEKKDAESGGEGSVDQPELNRIIDTFSDFAPEKRDSAEAALYSYFESLVNKCGPLEQSGKIDQVTALLEGFFEKVGSLGSPYRFKKTEARMQFVSRLVSTWTQFPYLGRWACIRMMGVVDGEEVREALRRAVKQGIFEDEAAVALMKTGDHSVLPVLLDNISRGRLSSERLSEVERTIIRRGDPELIQALIGFLANSDAGLRAAALSLLKKYSLESQLAPRDGIPTDADLKQRWERWWESTRLYYKPSVEVKSGVAALDNIIALNSLPEQGRLGKQYFKKLTGEIEDCCTALRSFQLDAHRRGELALYRLGRQMTKDYGAEKNKQSLNVMAHYMDIFTTELEKICLMQHFSDSQERREFLDWASGALEKGGVPSVVFRIRLLGVAGARETAASLHRYSDSWVPEVREAAIVSMGKLGSPEAAGAIQKLLQKSTISPTRGGQLVVALERINNEKALQALVQTMRGASPMVAYEAYLSLRRLRAQWGDPVSLGEFEEAREALVDDFAAWQEGKAPKKLK